MYMGINIKKTIKKVAKKATNTVSKVATKVAKTAVKGATLGQVKDKDLDNFAGTKVGSVVQKGLQGAKKVAEGATDLTVGVVTLDGKQIKKGAKDIWDGTWDVAKSTNPVIGGVAAVGNAIASGQDKKKEAEKEAKRTADALYQQQKDLAAFQKDEAVRVQNEAAVTERRNMYREYLKQQASAQNISGQSNFKSSAIQGAMSSLATDYASGQASVSSQLSANLNNINTTYDLGGDISQLSYNLGIQQQNAQQAAAGTAGIIQGGITGAAVGAQVGGPVGAVIGGGIGILTGGYSSGAFDF